MFKKIFFILDLKQKKKLIIYYFLSLFIIFLELLSIGMIIPVVHVILNPVGIEKYLPYLPREIINFSQFNLIILILAIFNILVIVKNFFLFFAMKFQASFICEHQQKLQMKLFKNYLYQPISDLMKNNIAIINRNVIDLSTDYTNVLLSSLMTILADIVLLTAIVLLLIYNEPTITIIGLSITSIIGVSIFLINKKIISSSGLQYKNMKGERIKTLNETFGGILEIKSFNKESLFIEKFEKFSKILQKIQLRMSVLGYAPRLLFEIIGIALISIFLLVIFNKIESLDEMLAIVALFAFAITRMTPLINKILINTQRIRYAVPILEEIYLVLKNFSRKYDNSDESLEFEREINLVNIGFKYEKSDYVLKDTNLSIKKNQFIAIMGKSGSGKTTLLKIILGLLKPTKGNIFLDDKSILLNLNLWQEKINFVPQDVFILDENLTNNITLETDKDKIDLDRLEFAINLADLKDFVKTLPDGYNTFLGDKGSRISGGQKQRIGIARAIYGSAQIIILDESTSSIDEKSESKIFENLKKLNKDKTIIFVTHKNSIKKYFDQIYIIENGTIKKTN